MKVKLITGTFITIIVVVILLLVGAILGLHTVDQSEVCTFTRFGKVVRIETTPGLKVAVFTSSQCYPITATMFQTGSEQNPQTDYWDYQVEIKTQDGQTGYVSFNILYTINPEYVLHIRQRVAQSADQLNERVVANFARSIPRDMGAEYTADGLYASQRAEYSADVEALLKEAYEPYGVVLLEFELRDVQFNPEYENAIEQQQIAEEGIVTQEFITEQKKFEAEQARIAAQGRADSVVIEAKAEAEALAVVARALRDNPNILQYEYIKKIAPNLRVMMIPAGMDNMLLNLPVP